MNRRLIRVLGPLAMALATAAVAVTLGACRRSDARGGGEPITGKASDPPVTFVARWDETNAFIYHLESITGTQVPRRNSDATIQQDTVLAKDLRLGVTNITPEGFRSLGLEIQAVRVETTSDQRLTSAFDTENELLSTEDNTIASRLRRVKGARLGFRLSPSNKILRVDGTKEFNDRIGSNRNVRGAAGAVLNKFFSQQYYRDLIEMSFLPTNPVRVGESWIVRLRSGLGLYNNAPTDLTYTFRGWQFHEGTNCARFDFAGNNRSDSASGRGTSSSEDTEIEGTIWFSPDLGVPVEMMVNQSITRNSASTRVVRQPGPGGGPNGPNPPVAVSSRKISLTGSTSAPPSSVPVATGAAGAVEVDDEPEPPARAAAPAAAAPGPGPILKAAPVPVTVPVPAPIQGTSAGPAVMNAPSGPVTTTTTSRTTTTKQHATLTLIEIVPVEPPVSARK